MQQRGPMSGNGESTTAIQGQFSIPQAQSFSRAARLFDCLIPEIRKNTAYNVICYSVPTWLAIEQHYFSRCLRVSSRIMNYPRIAVSTRCHLRRCNLRNEYRRWQNSVWQTLLNLQFKSLTIRAILGAVNSYSTLKRVNAPPLRQAQQGTEVLCLRI